MLDIYGMTFGSWQLWLSGLWQTLWLVSASLLLGLMIAIPCGVVLAARIHWFWKLPFYSFSYIFRGTPMLVQLYFFYYGLGIWLGQVEGIREHFLWPYLRQAWPWVLFAFALNTAAYTSEIIRGAIKTTSAGEIEAAKAFGMSRFTILKRIIFPSVIRRSLPSYGNEIIFMLQGSAIASVATLMDITGAARRVYSNYYEPFVPFITAGLLYLAITTVVTVLFRRLERRYQQQN